MYVLPDFKIAYFSVPKCGCSSVKHFLYQIDTGEEWDEEARGHIHRHHASQPFDRAMAETEGCDRIAVVRDPIDRLLSTYHNKIIDRGCLTKPDAAEEIAKRGLPELPTFEQFIDNLPGYRKSSIVVRRHSRPMTLNLGEDPSLYDLIVDISQLDTLAAYVIDRTGRHADLPVRNASRSKVVAPPISPEVAAKICLAFKNDYDIFAGHFVPSTRVAPA